MTAGPSCPAVPCSLVDTRFEKPKKAPLCLISPRAQDAFQGSERVPHLVSPLLDPIWPAPFRRVQSLMAHVHRRAPDYFARCSLPSSGPFVRRHNTCARVFDQPPRCSMSEEEVPLSQRDQLAMAVAQGKSIAGWARQNRVPRRTAPAGKPRAADRRALRGRGERSRVGAPA